MDEIYDFRLTAKEAAIIAAECSMSLADGRCSDPESRASLVTIIEKMAEPFGFTVDQLMAVSRQIHQMKEMMNESKH